MNKFLLLLLLFVSVSSRAQITLNAEFDFNDMDYLKSENVTPSSVSNGRVSVFGKVFKKGPISISFSMFTTSGGSATILTEGDVYNPGVYTYRLRITQGTVMTISCTDRTVINSIHISENSWMGDLGLMNGQLGKQSSNNWSSNGADVTSVSFWNTSSESRIDQLTVTYTTPSDVLTAISDLAPFRTSSFSQMKLTFDRRVSALDISSIRLTGSNSTDVKMNCYIPDGLSNEVTLSVDEAIKLDGTYTITVPRRSFESEDGYQNDDMAFAFTLQVLKTTFDTLSVSPVNRSTAESLAFPIKLVFQNEEEGDKIGKVDSEKMFSLWRSGRDMPVATIQAVIGEKPGEVLLNIVGEDEQPIYKLPGTYSLKVDQKTVYDQNYASDLYMRYNPDINLVYYVVDPLADLKADAVALKANIGSGVGYPAKGSTADEKLTDVTKTDATPTKDELEEAIAAYYAETQVVMPEEGKWYTIASIADDSQPIYLTYGNSAVSLGPASEAGTFKVNTFNAVDNTVVFETPDGKYLHVLTNSTEYDVSDEHATNVTTKKALCNLKLAKFDAASVTDKSKLEGMFSMYGYLGRIDPNSEKPDSAYSAIDHIMHQIVTASGKKLSFDKNGSHAFVMKEISVSHVKPSATLRPTTVNLGTTELTLTFNNAVKVTPIEGANDKPYFSTDAEGKNHVITAMAENILTTTNNPNQFTVHIDGLTGGSYFLIIPSGVFTYDSGDNFKIIDDSKLARAFQIVVPAPTLSQTYDYFSWELLSCVGKTIDYIADVDLNDLILFAYVPEDYTGLVADPTKEVWVIDGLLGGELKKGHFVSYDSFGKDFPQYADRAAIRLVLDEPYVAGDLKYGAGLYAYDIPAETFGNKEFGDYLNYRDGKTTAKPNYNKIKVNKRIKSISFQLDNVKAARERVAPSLKESIENATTYYNNIKNHFLAIADELKTAIETAKSILDDPSSSASQLTSAKEALDAVLEKAKSDVTGISTIELGEMFESVYTIDGRKLDGKPTKKGVYIVNGRKVVVN